MKKSQLKKIIKEEIKNTLKEEREHSSTVEAHELLEMIKDGLDDLQPGNDLIIRVNINDEGDDVADLYLNHLYDVEFETLGR